MKYKMLVSDLDETLLNDNGTINEKNVAAIKAASAIGFKFVPNTGRSYLSVQSLLKKLDLYDQAGQFVISYNGAAIIENKGNQLVLTQEMPFSLAKAVLDAGLVDATVDAHIYTVEKLYIYNLSDSDRQYMTERQVPYQIITEADITFLAKEPIMKVIFESADAKVREQIKAAVLAAVGNQVTATFSSNRYVEFNKQGVNKGAATLRLAQQLGIQASEVMAIGDNNNDIAMIEAAGLGIAVANAISTVKDIANLVTERTNNEGAIAEVLEQYVLGGK